MPRDNACTCTYPDRCDGLGWLTCVGKGCRCTSGPGIHEYPCLGCPACLARAGAVSLEAIVGAAADVPAAPAAHHTAGAGC